MNLLESTSPRRGILTRPRVQYCLAQVCLALLLTLAVESLSRRAVLGGLVFLFQSPLCFVYNALLIFGSLSVAQLVPKRRFVTAFVSCLWLGLGIANCVLLGYRTTPLAAIDFSLLLSVWSIMSVYLKVWQFVVIVLAIVLALAALVVVLVRAPKVPRHLPTELCSVALKILAALLATLLLQQAAVLQTSFGNLAEAYETYGFSYCFLTSLVDRGIDEPPDYSDEKVSQVVTSLDGAPADDDAVTPNILMVQLESFFDPKHVSALSCSEDPVPNFTALKEACPSGFLTVPSIGAGTANTEFEVLTGMSLDYFGTGEYPYKTILQSSTCETVNYDLKDLGYTCHAIHDHTGSFYDRQLVFSHLGFDTFTSVEYMANVTTNELGWAEDAVLTPQILTALDSTEGRDLVYTITVQAHGKYPTDEPGTDRPITVTGLEEDTDVWRWEYYLQQLHDTDAFIGDLIAQLEDYDEPVVLVLFGDHLPSLDIEDEDLDNGDLFQTEYVIWSNFGLEAEDRDLSAYQLSAYVLDLLDIHDGLLTKLHQTESDSEDYQEKLELLEYDMLYGNMDAYDGVNPYDPTDLQMGLVPISITRLRSDDDKLYVIGKNFTAASVVRCNGHTCETTYLGDSLLVAEVTPEDGDTITVAQLADDEVLLSETDAVPYEAS